MENKKKGFLRNFTWKRFFVFIGILFFITLLLASIRNYFDPGEKVADLFSQKEIINRVVLAIIVGFILTVMINPDADKKKV